MKARRSIVSMILCFILITSAFIMIIPFLSKKTEAQSFEFIKVLTEATGGINSVAFSPNGTYLALGSGDAKVRIYNTTTWSLIATLTEASNNVNSVAFSPDGTYLASGSEDNRVRIYNTATWSVITTLSDGYKVKSVAFSPDGIYLASGSSYSDNKVRVYNTTTWSLIATLTDATNNINSVAFSPNGTYLASGGGWTDFKVRIYNTATWNLVATLTDATSDIYSVAFSPDGTYLASGSADTKVRIYNIIIDIYPFNNSIIEVNNNKYKVIARYENMQNISIKTSYDGGTEETIYSNDSLGGINYFSIEGNYENWRNWSYRKIYLNISVYNGTWHNFTNSFYKIGFNLNKKMLYLDDTKTTTSAVIYKNQSGEYFLAVGQTDNTIKIKKSTNGQDWMNISVLQTLSNAKTPLFFYTYGGNLYLYYFYNNYVYYVTWNGVLFVSPTQVGALGSDSANENPSAIIYYDGKYHLFAGNGKRYTGTPPNSWTYADDMIDYCSNPVIFGGYLYVFYAKGDGVYYRYFDGVNWFSENKILPFNSAKVVAVKNPISNFAEGFVIVNNIIYCFSYDFSINKTFGVVIALYNTYGKQYPSISFIDNSTIMTFSSNDRGNYNAYWITKDHLKFNNLAIYNRIQFPDATPNQEHVNSSVITMQNVGLRNVTYLEFRFTSNIGSITYADNIKIWGSTDNSTWTDLGVVDANGYLNITSTTWSSGIPINVGETRYIKFEILNVGNVPEDLHRCEEAIILKVGLE